MDLEEAASVLQDAFHTMGYSWNMYPYSYNETDGEYNWYQTEYDYHVDTDDENTNGTTVEICADTATGQLHGIYIWSEDEKAFFRYSGYCRRNHENSGPSARSPGRR